MTTKFAFYLFFVLFAAIALAIEPLPVYTISLTLYDDSSITLDKIHLSTAFKGRDFLSGPYSLRLISVDGGTLYIDRFGFEGTAPPKEWFDENGKQILFPKRLTKPVTDQVAQPINRVTLTVPYFKEANQMQIYDSDGRLALNIDLSIYCEGEGCLRKGSFFSRITRWLGKIF